MSVATRPRPAPGHDLDRDLPPDRLLMALAARRRGGAPRGGHRMRVLLRELGSPHLGLRTVHVVGTNGKTSVVRIVASLLDALGLAVGDTTSPHLQDVRERIRLDGRPVDDGRLAAACRRVAAALPHVDVEVGESATFFEAVTASALSVFAEAGVDVAVVEAGIGGVGDATSVVQARVGVLTPVGLDHPELGGTLAEVAREKAGVVPPGGVLAVAAQPPEAADAVDRVVAARGARLLRAGRDFGVLTRRPSPDGQLVGLRGLDGSLVRGVLPLRGGHQAANAALALATVQALLGTVDLDPAALRRGLERVRVSGRVERIRRDGAADVVLDGAHDVPAVRALVEALEERRPPGRPTVVFGIGGGRDPWPLLEPLRRLTDRFVLTRAASPTAAPMDDCAARLRAEGAAVALAPDVAEALHAATAMSDHDGVVVVTGSLHLVGDARGILGVDAGERP